MKKSLFQLWKDLLSENEQLTLTTFEMVAHGMNTFFPQMDEDSDRFKTNFQTLEGWYKEFKGEI